MANLNKYPLRGLVAQNMDNEKPDQGQRMPGEKKRQIEDGPGIDFSVFRKSPAEKELLKALRSQAKTDALRKGFSAEKNIESLKSRGISF